MLPIFSLIDPSKEVVSLKTGNSSQIVAPPKHIVAEPVSHHPTIRRFTGRESYSTPSILDALKDDVKAEDVGIVSEVAANQYSKNTLTHAFSQQELVDGWKNFVETIDFPQLKSALSIREPLLTNNWLIEYELDTELQLNRLTLDLKPKLLGFLRHKFRNDAIEIQFKVSGAVEHQSNIPYTDAERWALLAEKYPSLALLKSKFGLDFEHF